jgi:hypothetical protein
VDGLGGLGGTCYYQISLSSLQFVLEPLTEGDLRRIVHIRGYIDSEGNLHPATQDDDREKLLVDAHISSARAETSAVSSQFIDFGPGVSAGWIDNVSSMVFRLRVKTMTEKAVRARASIVVYSVS